ncbi:hypothetical protein Trco_002013 [Trichoderma cornu-damae]|uniref:Uncharacterized protein n=1 Tax=Trichoderma cornu-damae TaxID=654480 RepID=A0A9P8QU89_9HYPO|nr:hypothetical protein Trco_002013 [Trichoderma cornu-damae]
MKKDGGLPLPRWALSCPAAAPPILTYDQPSLEPISHLSGAGSLNSSAPRLDRTFGEACSPEGQWNCMTTSWQRCASGTWSAVVQCAAGTICQPSSLTDYITIEHEPSANDGHDYGHGHADDGRADSDGGKDGKKSLGLRGSPSLVLLLAALATGVSWWSLFL